MRTTAISYARTGVLLLALLLALGPSAQALPNQNTVDSGDIQNGQVKRPDLAENAVNGVKVADDSLSGGDVDESKLMVKKMGCQDGLIKGFATVAYYTPPTTFTNDLNYIGAAHTCGQGAPEVRREGYITYVRFPGLQIQGTQLTIGPDQYGKTLAAYSKPAPDTVGVICTNSSDSLLHCGFHILVY